jgi:hypothetical protein
MQQGGFTTKLSCLLSEFLHCFVLSSSSSSFFIIITAMKEFTREDAVSILQRIGLECYVETFIANDIDGPMLEAIADPNLGEGILKNLGMHDKGHCQRFITEIYRAKSKGLK